MIHYENIFQSFRIYGCWLSLKKIFNPLHRIHLQRTTNNYDYIIFLWIRNILYIYFNSSMIILLSKFYEFTFGSISLKFIKKWKIKMFRRNLHRRNVSFRIYISFNLWSTHEDKFKYPSPSLLLSFYFSLSIVSTPKNDWIGLQLWKWIQIELRCLR